LTAAFNAGSLNFFSDLASLAEPAAFAVHLVAMRRISWVVYAKRPFGGPAQVLAYLGRYTHRVAIANSRLVALDEDHVAFTWKDYRQNGATKTMRLVHPPLPSSHTARRLPSHPPFRLHGQPPSCRQARALPQLLDDERTAPNDGQPSPVSSDLQTPAEVPACPYCGDVMRIVERFRHSFRRSSPRTSPFRCDTS
jgi:hypothetical protein